MDSAPSLRQPVLAKKSNLLGCLWFRHLMDSLAPDWCMRYQTKRRDFPWFLLIRFCAVLDHTPKCKRQGKIFQKLQWVCFEQCRSHSSHTLTDSLLHLLIIFVSLAYFPFIQSHLSFYSHVLYFYIFLYSPLSSMFIFISPFLLTVLHSWVLPSLVFSWSLHIKKNMLFPLIEKYPWIPPTL